MRNSEIAIFAVSCRISAGMADIRASISITSCTHPDGPSQLFIGRSNQDKAITGALTVLSRVHGHKSLFIDCDPVAGMPAGSKWLTELYRNLDASEGVIVICSEHPKASKWCFARKAFTGAEEEVTP